MSRENKQNYSNDLYNDPYTEEIENRELLALAKERSEEFRSGKSSVYTWEEIKAKHRL